MRPTLKRVVRAILNRYLVTDPPLSTAEEPRFKLPRFLFNDVVRFWRTMTVDYATKKWERSNRGWALRNIKLRMSRKLLFVKGILVCFLCDDSLGEACQTHNVEMARTELAIRCNRLCGFTPLDLLARAVLDHGVNAATTRQLFDSYDSFLEMLNNEGQRKELEGLEFDDALGSDLFRTHRENSHLFRDALESFFFRESQAIANLSIRYGVF